MFILSISTILVLLRRDNLDVSIAMNTLTDPAPSQPAHFWRDIPHLFGGTDLEMGGTWLAYSTTGRLAAITNYHSKTDTGCKFPKSRRGERPIQFCERTLSAKNFAEGFRKVEKYYGGSNVFLFDANSLVCCSNRDLDQLVKDLSPGIYD